MADIKKIPQVFGVTLENALGRDGARYFKEVVDALNTKIDELTSATAGNIAVFDSNGRLTDFGDAPLTISLTGLRLVASDASGDLSSVSDLTSWIGGVAGRIAVSDDGDGTLTLTIPLKVGFGIDSDADGLKLKQQTHITDAQTVHAATDPSDSPATADALRDDLVANTIPSIESALNALGTKVNEILTALETAEILAT